MLVEPGETVVLLPAATRYEQEGGGTSTTTERRVAFSPELDGPRVGEARSEYAIFLDVARRVDPERAGAARLRHRRRRSATRSRASCRRYAGIETSARPATRSKSAVRACAKAACSRPADGRARFSVVVPADAEVPPGHFLLSTRRGKQFNSMVWADVDPLTGAGRDALLLSEADAGALGVADGDALLVRSPLRRDASARARRADPRRQRAGVLPRGERPARRRIAATRSRVCPTTTPSSRWSRHA